MNIEPRAITVRELAEGYEDNAEGGVLGYGGKLDIRPPYQREFIYKDKQRDAVIETARKDFPLNVMYWAVRDDGGYEIIDGQQRTISLCQYVHDHFSIDISGNRLMFANLQDDQRTQLLDYKLTVYLCSGTNSEKLDWFKTINIAGEELEDQELRNAVYHGPWTADAKRYFSKTGCAAYNIGSDYMTGVPIRQKYLETAIDWHADATGVTGGPRVDPIDEYMSRHQQDDSAGELWHYFQSVINWVSTTFPRKRNQMKSVDWGRLFNAYGTKTLDPTKLEGRVAKLMMDDDVTKKPGIYPYVLDGKESHLNVRAFTANMKVEAHERQKGICAKCNEHFELKGMEADHITPWHEGGKTDATNCQMLCKDCNRRKSGK